MHDCPKWHQSAPCASRCDLTWHHRKCNGFMSLSSFRLVRLVTFVTKYKAIKTFPDSCILHNLMIKLSWCWRQHRTASSQLQCLPYIIKYFFCDLTLYECIQLNRIMSSDSWNKVYLNKMTASSELRKEKHSGTDIWKMQALWSLCYDALFYVTIVSRQLLLLLVLSTVYKVQLQ